MAGVALDLTKQELRDEIKRRLKSDLRSPLGYTDEPLVSTDPATNPFELLRRRRAGEQGGEREPRR
eukprot:292014-Lingulodinium_polyedra.AAC.1